MLPELDSLLDGLRSHEGVAKKDRAGVKTDVVVIRCGHSKVSAATGDNMEGVGADADDLIWWSWDGKIIGFVDL